MSMEQMDMVFKVVGALTVLLTVVANLPPVAKSRAGAVMHKFVAIDFVGLLRLVMPLLALKAAPKEPPKE
jgi:hypothetical protein